MKTMAPLTEDHIRQAYCVSSRDLLVPHVHFLFYAVLVWDVVRDECHACLLHYEEFRASISHPESMTRALTTQSLSQLRPGDFSRLLSHRQGRGKH